MDKNKAIEMLRKGYPNINRYAASELNVYEYDVDTYNEAVGYAISHLEEDRWISVKNKLPDKNDYYYVWAFVGGKERPCVSWFDGDFILNGMGFKVLAWKPTLCEPYKESEDE